MTASLALPKRSRGRPSPEAQAEYEAALAKWCAGIMEIYERRAEDPNNFEVSSRGCCYLLESHGLHKGDFDIAQKVLNDCRKSGLLPLGICCEDGRRSAENLEEINDEDPKQRAAVIVDYVERAEDYYHPQSFWEAQDTYVVEKGDLKNLFSSVCEPFRIPIFNASGWSDLHSRAAMLRPFAHWEYKGKRCVLLYCGDLDPGGLRITDFIRSNLADLTRSVGWSPDNLIIDRFGIDIDLIRKHRLTWIATINRGIADGSIPSTKYRDRRIISDATIDALVSPAESAA